MKFPDIKKEKGKHYLNGHFEISFDDCSSLFEKFRKNKITEFEFIKDFIKNLEKFYNTKVIPIKIKPYLQKQF